MKPMLRKLHRWISLTAATFWLLQALTGVFLVFHWEIDDALVDGPARPLDARKFDAALQSLVATMPGHTVYSIWATAGSPGRYEVSIDDPDAQTVQIVRMDGQGALLRSRDASEKWAQGGWVKQIVSFHQNLLAGDVGHGIVGVSGVLLLTNIALGLQLAWPARGQWRRILWPSGARGTTAGLYAWHRALGLWVAAIALVTVSCGVLLVFEGPVGRWVGAAPIVPSATEVPEVPGTGFRGYPVSAGQAIETATSQFGGAELAGMYFPTPDQPWYRIRVLQSGETRRVFGTSTVFVGARSGRILGTHDALAATPARTFMDILFPIHTGEIAGFAGRVAIVVIGLWLATMIVLGVSLWQRRRSAAPADGQRAQRT